VESLCKIYTNYLVIKMNLLEIRTKFAELSGRWDLVNKSDYSDNGADYLIREAGKWLDKCVETSKSSGNYLSLLSAGSWYVQFPYCRALKEVWMATTGGRTQLTKMNIQDLIVKYLSCPPAEITNGTPAHYALADARYIREGRADLATFTSYVGIITPTTHEYNTIILSAPVDQNTLIEVIGLFYAVFMTANGDSNYWSVVHPNLLIQATIRQTYIFSGNKPMLDVLDRGIDGELTRLGYDLVEEEIAECDQMGG
jgi:hypothetical protein